MTERQDFMEYILDINSPVHPLNHYWELCVGSGHAVLALREDYRQQLAKCARELGFRYVRFHGLFSDDMSVCLSVRRGFGPGAIGGEVRLSFTNIDSIFDFLLSIGMKPFVELSFMPEVLTSGTTTLFHWKALTSPPNDYDRWEWLVEQFASHCVDRYGLDEVRQWYFEVWNEPNLGGRGASHGFWGGDLEDYLKLYDHSAAGLKKVDQRLRVGGPSTADNEWVPELIRHCSENNVPLDFITTHNYATDLLTGPRHGQQKLQLGSFKDMSDEDRKRQMNTMRKRRWETIPRGILTDWAKEVREEAGDLPLIYTEWNPQGGEATDGPFGSSFTVKTVMDNHGIVDGYSYWTFSDIFEEQGMPHVPFAGTFGMQTIQGIPKAPYRAFQLLHKLGFEEYDHQYAEGNIDIYAVRKEASSAIQILIVNHNSLEHPIEDETVQIKMTGVQTFAAATIERIDETHGNPVRRWHELGEPDYLTQNQISDLEAASYVKVEALKIDYDGDTLTTSVDIPAMGVALITVFL